MTPEQKIKWLILAEIAKCDQRPLPEITAGNVDALYDECEDKGDIIHDVRQGDVETNIVREYSRLDRFYESKSVAAQMPDGSWVGWTYWYGGGKHGAPGEIDWMDTAYELTCVEEPKVVTVRTFTKTAA